MILLITEGDGYAFEDVDSGVRVETADAIRLGFAIPPQTTAAALRFIDDGLARTKRTDFSGSKWEAVCEPAAFKMEGGQ